MPDISQNNKRIAKNTLILYVRMLALMLVSLYTSRVVLNALGVEDYGIYNVVGGVVSMFSILSGSLSAAISRFITFELGRGDAEKLKRVFSAAVTIQLVLAVIVLVLAEGVGVWFLNAKMNIPDERMSAANWVFQLSLLRFVVNVMSVPYSAAIIAHEKMSAFAYISIFEAVGKLGISLLITIAPLDRLIFYSLLMCIMALTVRFVYTVYCRKNFVECHARFIWDWPLLKQMFGFAGWNFIGSTSAILRDQGGNVIINLFAGPAVNAARGIGEQVKTAVSGFSSNFMTALGPQITKSYASGDRTYMMQLMFQGARLSYYLLFFIALPVLVNTPYILTLWLKIVPEHTVLFVRLALLFSMSESISSPLITGMLATGNIRNYQIVVGGLQLMNLPLAYIMLRIGFIPETVTMIAIALSQCCLAARLIMLRGMIGLQVRKYIKEVYINVVGVTVFSSLIPFACKHFLPEDNFLMLILNCVVCVICTAIVVYFVGCNKRERDLVRAKSRTILSRVFRGDKSR